MNSYPPVIQEQSRFHFFSRTRKLITTFMNNLFGRPRAAAVSHAANGNGVVDERPGGSTGGARVYQDSRKYSPTALRIGHSLTEIGETTPGLIAEIDDLLATVPVARPQENAQREQN